MAQFSIQESVDQVTPAVSTGIAGLDEILVGGLTDNRIYLVEGSPGSGKTTLALQFRSKDRVWASSRSTSLSLKRRMN